MSRKLSRPHESKIGKPDLAMRMRYATSPATMEIVSHSRRGDEFLAAWVNGNDEGARAGLLDGRLYIVLLQSDVEKCLLDAAKADLVF